MRQRWLPVAGLALTLFVINVVARFVVWQTASDEWQDQIRIGLVSAGVTALVCVAAGMWWAYRTPVPRLVADIGAAVLAACVLVVLIGPYAGGSSPFEEGASLFVRQILYYIGISAFGTLVGVLLVTAFGKDWRSRGYRRRELLLKQKPVRTARR